MGPNDELDTHYTISKDERATGKRSKLQALAPMPKFLHSNLTASMSELIENSAKSKSEEWPAPYSKQDSQADGSFGQQPTPPRGSHHSPQTAGDDRQATQLHGLQWLLQRNKQLEDEIHQLCEGSLGIHRPPSLPNNIQVFHCLYLAHHDNDGHGGDKDNRWNTYLSKPRWEIQAGHVTLRGHFLVPDSREYIKRKGGTDFVVYQYYKEEHQLSAVKAALRDSGPIPEPEPAYQHILLNSDDMVNTVQALFEQFSTLRMEFPKVHKDQKLESPFIWWYHCRKLHAGQSPRPEESPLLTQLIDWIENNYAATYEAVDEQFRRGRVSSSSMEYFIRPGQVVVPNNNEGLVRGYLAVSRPALEKDTPRDGKEIPAANQRTWTVEVERLDYSGGFHCFNEQLSVKLETGTEDEEVDIASLTTLPLEHVSHSIREGLLRRGKMFWKFRNRQLVSYEGDLVTGKHGGQRFMLDFETYNELHPPTSYQSIKGSKTRELPANDTEPQSPDIYLFPPETPGFDLRRKKWVDLEVDQIREVVWNERAFENLVADVEMKELILALVTNQLGSETNTDLIKNKGNGLIMLLHGPPGTGKTYTAESVAEIAKKPLYPVTCGDIGTEPEQVENYLESVFHLGKTWDCVVLLDEAEVFLEQRTLQDLKRNALVSVFLRALEYYEGILILTTNRVGTFDEAFKSRIQLALRYERLQKHERKQIWRNFFDRLKGLEEEETIDFDDVQEHMDELADYEMNGRQIRNSITTARQLAKYKKKPMRFTHLKRAITAAEKFDKYLADVREGDVDDTGGRRGDGRYSDDYFARADQIR